MEYNLPYLSLVQIGVDVRSSSLLAHVNFSSLKSLSMRSMAKNYNLAKTLSRNQLAVEDRVLGIWLDPSHARSKGGS